MPEENRADESLSVEEDRHDPDALYRMLKGGFSSGSGRRYPGLGEQVLKRITEIYAVPSPLGYSGDVRLKGEERWTPRGGSHEADAVELAIRLQAWLGVPIETGSRVERDELLSLARRSTSRALSMVRARRRGAPPPISRRARAYELVEIYLLWLGRSCDHKRAKKKGRVTECPDCHAVRIDV